MGEASRLVGGQMMDMMRGPIAAFAEAEDAATRLKTAMMDATGQVAAEFDGINKLATELGYRLAGTTKDFQHMMTVLVDQGMSYQAILGGLGETAVYLAVGLKMPFDEVARFGATSTSARGWRNSRRLRKSALAGRPPGFSMPGRSHILACPMRRPSACMRSRSAMGRRLMTFSSSRRTSPRVSRRSRSISARRLLITSQ
ncbi:MAG: phage tail tape measure protein [Rhodocyclaceae bacterium]|nr:phage tail tape measure protein [Rhodocyclaceae bacterium]